MARAPARKRRARAAQAQALPPARAAEEQWRAENKQAIEHYNSFVERYGVFSDDFRQF